MAETQKCPRFTVVCWEIQVYYDVYPVWTYSYLSLLVLVFLVTDILRYKPVIVFEGIGYVITWSLLLWSRGVRSMQTMEFFYGIATSTEVAYYTYIYAQVHFSYYQKVTSYTRSAILSGRFISAVMSQVLYSTGSMDYHQLNYLSLASVSLAFLIAISLPTVRTSAYFHRYNYGAEVTESSRPQQDMESRGFDVCQTDTPGRIERAWQNVRQASVFLWTDFKDCYSNHYLLKWSVWWAFATCINFQVGNYIQPLWETIAPFRETESLYNGAIEATSTLIGAMAAFGVGYVHLNWTLFGELILGIISLIDAVLLIAMGLTNEIWVAYINYVLFRVSYQVLITIASYQVAKALQAESFGLIFGINMFVALFMQTILTVAVIEVLEISPGMQFVVYGFYFCILASLFLGTSCYQLGTVGCQEVRRQGFWEGNFEDSERHEAPTGTTESY